MGQSRAKSVAAMLAAAIVGSLAAAPAFAQSSIPPNLTSLRPIKCIAYDPKPSDFVGNNAYFDSDFFNSDFTAIWGDDGQPGARNDLKTFADAKLNLLHLYNWNGERANHTVALDAAQARGIKVMVPINNFTAQTIIGDTPGCGSCPHGYKRAFEIVQGIFNQVYRGGKTPHPAAAMWGIYNEYDLNKYNPVDVAFVAQAIITLEDRAGIAVENRLPITAPVSDAMWSAQQRQEARLPREINLAFARAAQEWQNMPGNAGKNINTPNPPDLPGAVIAILAIADALSDAQSVTSYKSKFDTEAVNVSAVPADHWKTRWIASSNPFRGGSALVEFITKDTQFKSAFPGTTNFNTLPPLFFGEMGRSQVDARNQLYPPGDYPPPAEQPPCGAECLAAQAAWVLDQIESTNALASNPATTKDGYFLGSCMFQHTFVDTSNFQAFDVTPGAFSPRAPSPGAPCPACNQAWRVDQLTPLPVWASVTTGYGKSLLEDWRPEDVPAGTVPQ